MEPRSPTRARPIAEPGLNIIGHLMRLFRLRTARHRPRDCRVQSAGADRPINGAVSALRFFEKRRELAGIIDELQRQLDQHRADLMHIDGVLRVLATDLDPEMIRPKRVYRRNRYFARNELSRLCRSEERR